MQRQRKDCCVQYDIGTHGQWATPRRRASQNGVGLAISGHNVEQRHRSNAGIYDEATLDACTMHLVSRLPRTLRPRPLPLVNVPSTRRAIAMTSFMPDTLNPATLLSKRFRPDQIPDLSGRVALVTGGSAGIGYWDVAALAQHGAKVHFVSANPDHGRQAETDLNTALEQSGSKGSIVYHQLDMGNLKKVDSWVKKFAQQEKRLDILIANAGIGQAPWGLTDDGLERHFEVCTRSPCQLPLIDRIYAGQQPRTLRHSAPAA